MNLRRTSNQQTDSSPAHLHGTVVALAAEQILLEDQPKLKRVEWISVQKIQEREVSMTRVLWRKAAELLARRPMAGHAAGAHD